MRNIRGNNSIDKSSNSITYGRRPGIFMTMFCFMLLSVFLITDVTKALPVDRNVDFTISNQLNVIGTDQILTLKVGSNNWKNVVGGIAAFNIKIGYDQTVFEYIETKVTPESKIIIGKDEFTETAQNAGVLAVLYMDNNFQSPIPAEGAILNITFKVKNLAVTGGYRFTIYGDKVIVDGQLPTFNSVPVYYPSPSTVFLIGTDPIVTPTPTLDPSVTVTPPLTGEVTPSLTGSVTPGITPNPNSGTTSSQPDVTVSPIPTGATSNSSISDPAKDYTNIIKTVTEKIEKLPERITADDAKEVKAILKEYNKLPDNEKKKVVNFDKLEKLNVIADKFIDENNKSLAFKVILLIVVVVCLAFASALIVRIRKRKRF